jgi:hypothetical protein
MKKVVMFILITLLVLSVVGIVYSSLSNKTITITYRNISTYVNDQKKISDAEPFIYNGRTYVPLRFISEALNKEVKWDDKTSRIDINDKSQSSEEWKKVIEFAGRDSIKTKSFIIHSKTWKIVFSAQETITGYGMFYIYVYSTDDPNLFTEAITGPFKNGTLSNESYIYEGGKNYFLDITAANCEYIITVYEQQ